MKSEVTAKNRLWIYRTRIILIPGMTVLMVVMLLVSMIQARQGRAPERTGYRLTALSGDVYYFAGSNYEKTEAYLLMNISAGLRLRTGADGGCKIIGPNRTGIFVGRLTEIVFRKLDNGTVLIELVEGIVAAENLKSNTPLRISVDARVVELTGQENRVMVSREKRMQGTELRGAWTTKVFRGAAMAGSRRIGKGQMLQAAAATMTVRSIEIIDVRNSSHDFRGLLDDDFIVYDNYIKPTGPAPDHQPKLVPGTKLQPKDETPPPLVITRIMPEMNGELTVYGYSEAQATLEIDGYPIEVLPDGSFSQKLDFIKTRRIPEIIARDQAGNESRHVLNELGDYFSTADDFTVTATPATVDARGPFSQLVDVQARFINSQGKAPSPTLVRFEAVSASGANMGEIIGSSVAFTDYSGQANIQFRPGYFPGQAFMRVFNHTTGEELGSTSITLRDYAPDRVPGVISTIQNSVLSNNTLTLTWSGGNIEGDFNGYRLYKNGSLIATYPPGTTSYFEEQMTEDDLITYEVRAIDLADPMALESESLSTTVTIGDNSAPIMLGAGGVTGSAISIDVTFSEDLAYIGNYSILSVFPADVPAPLVLSRQFIGNGTVRLWLNTNMVLNHSYELRISDVTDDGSNQNTLQPNPTRTVINY